VAIWKVGGNLHPFLPLCPDSSGVALEFLGDKPVQQRILQPAAVVLLE